MISIGILCYEIINQDGRNNIGDWYQTAAAMYIWWKYFKSKETFAQFIQTCITTETMHSYPITWLYRDSLSLSKFNGTKIVALMNGWWMSDKKGLLDFPPSSNIVPIYTSFHLGDNRILSTETIEHLKLYEPIGCRDISTQEHLDTLGIKTTFSGCLSMVLNLRDPQLGMVKTLDYSETHVFVDVPVNTKADTKNYFAFVTQEGKFNKDPAWIYHSLQHTYNLLDAYAITTCRLHIWLPLICNNVNVHLVNKYTQPYRLEDVDFVSPKNDRFRGLFGLLNERREEIIRELSKDCHNNIHRFLS
jgi:hypothetical protein